MTVEQVDTTAVTAQLVKDLRRQVSLLEEDLRVRAYEIQESAEALQAEYTEAKKAQRTAATYESWLDERVTQVAVAWVLGTVFVRYCEDNGLIAFPFIAGPGERLTEAEERHEAYFREHPNHNDRDWIIAAFDYIAATHPAVAALFERKYNPLWEIPPSFEAATELLRFWRRSKSRYDFTYWDTRFLGDIYQDLSEHARKTYALLQTPEFVEEFILDLTLEPAVKEFGLADLRTIDPACGSGHFLLGIFRRLLMKWRDAEPGTELWDLIRRTLESVHGCDKNPFAVSIARFRLLVAVVGSAKIGRFDQAPNFPINIAVGDSLMHGRGVNWEQIELDLFVDGRRRHAYRTEDIHNYIESCNLLGIHSYHVVVGNPPYITVKDKKENENYREVYKQVCSGKYALSVPFAQRLFDLAVRAHGDGREAGFIGQITANSFMKREFGVKLIKEFFPTVHLTHIIDTSGVYIPGHGTPTVIIIGRNHYGRAGDRVRAVLGVRGEPAQPENPAEGYVWNAITSQISHPGSESEWISVADIERSHLAEHPLSMSGGGAKDLLAALETSARSRLRDFASSAGITSVTGEDDLFLLPRNGAAERLGIDSTVPLLTGETIRDYFAKIEFDSIWVYDQTRSVVAFDALGRRAAQLLEMYRAAISRRKRFGVPMLERGMAWYEWQEIYPNKLNVPLSIVFAFVATHNHFVLDRGGKVFKQSAPVIKLPAGTEEGNHLALVGVLNSSAACFWLKQVSQAKAGGGTGRGMQDEAWEERYEFTGTKLLEYPLPVHLPFNFGRDLDALAQQLASREPSTVCDSTPSRERLDAASAEYGRIRQLMISLQEEMDWTVYHSYGLLTDVELERLTVPEHLDAPEVELGERAFEIVLARKMAAGETETSWFARHGSTPITEIPVRWPKWYREIVQSRIGVVEERRDIALIERPECKRRWASQPWVKKEAEALRIWLLNRCERRDYWYGLRNGFEQPRMLTVNQLADRFRDDTDMHDVAKLYATSHLRKPDLTLAQVLEQIIADQHVPYLAALRYKDTGLRKRKQWEQVWELQWEDSTGKRDVPLPPKYTSSDFRKITYWFQRGKLDVPKERFISYPDANPDSDPTLLLGWAGWDHADQAQALVNLINDRTADAGWETERITPILAGLAEVMPWVHQWHNDYDEDWGGNPAEEYQAFLDQERTKHQLTEADLTNWRPAPAKRGRKNGKQK